MSFKTALRNWCKRKGIKHREFSDEELIKMRSDSRKLYYGCGKKVQVES